MQSSSDRSSPYIAPELGGLTARLAWQVRQKMFVLLRQVAAITPATKVLDVGVTCDRREECNFFEKLYPYPHNLTAVGMEDASFLTEEYPGLQFVQTDGSTLPFPDQSFDLAVSFAVLQHVGSRPQQQAFIQELCRVGRTCFITTPNRWYPVDFHTALPLVHWLPPTWFRQILKWLGQDFLAKEENLNLLTEKEVLAMFPPAVKVHKKHFKLFGLTSHLIFYINHEL